MEQNTEAEAPIVPVVDNKQKNGKGLKIALAVACIIAACGIGFGVYGIIQMNNKAPETPGNSQTTATITTDPDNQSLSSYEINDLKNKTLRLLGSRNGLSKYDYYNDDSGDFMILTDYMPISELLANELDDYSKTYITLETTILDKEKYCNYEYNEDVKADIDAALGQKADIYGGFNTDCISYDKANLDHNDLWGEDIQKLNGTSKVNTGDYAYGSNSDAFFYHILGGRGGTFANYAIGKITQISNDQNGAYVDIDAGSFSTVADEVGKLYPEIAGGEIYKTVDQDISSWDELGLTEGDFESFQSYRFNFKKSPNGIYYFSNVEKK